jgi:hypothetical protein
LEDANLACGLRLTKVAERKAQEALRTVQTLRERAEQDSKAARSEELKKQITEMYDALYTPKWEQLGGDARVNGLTAEYQQRDCNSIVGQPSR